MLSALTDTISDIELVCNNARVGAQVSVELARLGGERVGRGDGSQAISSGRQSRERRRELAGVCGGSGSVNKRPVIAFPEYFPAPLAFVVLSVFKITSVSQTPGVYVYIHVIPYRL